MNSEIEHCMEEYFEKEIRTALKTRYTGKAAREIERRAGEEWVAVLDTGSLAEMAAAYELTRNLKEEGQVYSMRGTAGDSFLLYLLGITLTNPLPPHLRCPRCHHVVWKKGYGDGWDVPQEICPVCGTPMLPDGHDIPWQMHWGYGVHPVAFDLEIDRRLGEKLKVRAEKHWLRRLDPGVSFSEFQTVEGHPGGVKLGGIHVGCTLDFSGVSGQFWENPAEPSRALFQEEKDRRRKAGIPEPETYAELIRSAGLLHGTGTRDAERENDMDMPAFREDVFLRLCRENIPKDAWRDAEAVSCGHSNCYLFPKGHITETMLFRMKAGRVKIPITCCNIGTEVIE